MPTITRRTYYEVSAREIVDSCTTEELIELQIEINRRVVHEENLYKHPEAKKILMEWKAQNKPE
ncbi:hypothetical protein [Psychroflexus sp. ALD_RP9]|uniref:hypothetical protein n=1 Tax=Psychroflexus sp. ALD_RP9 TaxID=2777186 RepID=UPI001A8C6ECF|nr:hypothetical protein [Psychroflexus sp. ALD_RP9]QSS96604.1 hypothetical protein IMZ30_09140 [Psychroflexus sp. ALD_RP9]